MPPQETKWTHAPLSSHESRCCSFCNKRAKTTGRAGEEWSRLLTVVERSAGRRRSAMLGCRRSQLPLVRPSRSLLRAPPGARPRRTTRGRVSRPGGSGRSLCRTVAVHSIRLCSRRRTVTVVTAVGTVSSVGGGRRRCVPHCLFVVLQYLGHGCLHGPARFLALLAQLTAQSQGGCPG